MQHMTQKSSVGIIGRANDKSSSTVSKNYRDISAGVSEIESSRVNFGADNQHLLGLTAANESIRCRQRIEEARALVSNIKASNSWQSKAILKETCGPRKIMIRTEGRHNNHVDITDVDSGIRKRFSARFLSHYRRGIFRS
jgi:hypothetical protein